MSLHEQHTSYYISGGISAYGPVGRAGNLDQDKMSRAAYHRAYRQRTDYNKNYDKKYKVLGTRVDRAMYARIVKKAKADNVTITETVCTLLEWGLEAEKR